jgi:colanic acid biosynthesis glycosyl transferase WcaI
LRILIHGLNFAPELVGVGKYTGEMAEWLAVHGHEVRVVTAPPFNPQRKVETGYSPWHYSKQHSRCDGTGSLTVIRCPLWVPSKPSTIIRLLHLASFALSSFPVVLRQIRWRPEVVIVIEPTLLCLPAARCCARWSAATSWLHIQDFEADAAFELGLVDWPLLRKLVEGWERKSMSRFDRVSTISRKMLERLSRKGVLSSRSVLFENWVDTSQIYPMDKVSPVRAELGIPPQAVVGLYSGSMGNKQGLDVLVEAAGKLATDDHFHFVFCTDGPARSRLASLTAQVRNIHVLPLQPVARLNELLNAADIHLLPQRADAADLVMPSKLTGMLASGRPVIATAHSGTQLADAVSGRGLVVPPGDVAALISAIRKLAGDLTLREELGRNARNYAISELEKSQVLSRFEGNLYASRPLSPVGDPTPSVLSGSSH